MRLAVDATVTAIIRSRSCLTTWLARLFWSDLAGLSFDSAVPNSTETRSDSGGCSRSWRPWGFRRKGSKATQNGPPGGSRQSMPSSGVPQKFGHCGSPKPIPIAMSELRNRRGAKVASRASWGTGEPKMTRVSRRLLQAQTWSRFREGRGK